MVKFITFTGVDIKTDISRVNRLSERYNVEWGVLYSPSKKDDNRYSSYETVSELVNKIHKPALHLCGKAINQFIDIEVNLQFLLREMFINDNRVQLNTNLSSLSKTKLNLLINNIESSANKFILQFNENNKDYINQVNSNYNIKVINNWNRFSNTNYFKRNFQVLKLSNLPFAGKFHCSTCPNISSNCGLTYSLSPNGFITTSFESGNICLAYLKYAKDENDEYIIPDNEDLIQALANWCMAKHWELRMNMKEEGTFNIYSLYINKAQNLFQKVRGIFITKSFDFQTWKNIVFKDIKWASSYTIFNKSRYTNLGTHSRIKVNI